MEVSRIAFGKTGYYADLICDYLDQKNSVQDFYHRFPSAENMEDQIAEKLENYRHDNRQVLHEVLKGQYQDVSMSAKTKKALEQLKDPNTFTVTTGHQLNLFTGPLYFLYKIIDAINLADKLTKDHAGFHFVPIYWMASEDHDFDEIDHFGFRGQKLKWERGSGGPVGRFDNKGLDKVLQVFQNQLGNSDRAKEIVRLFRDSYLGHENLAAATRFLANELFGDRGLVIIDADDPRLKALFKRETEKDIFENIPFNEISASVNRLKEAGNYKVQVNPREINFFYMTDRFRGRLLFEDGLYKVDGSEKTFSTQELEKELHEHPERFSPNVVMRPVYQEVILPNLVYIGGGGEIAYWLELKNSFEALDITFPMLMVRNSVLLISQKSKRKLEAMDMGIADLFGKRHEIVNKKIRKISNIEIDMSPQKKFLEEQFEALYEMAEQTDASFLGAVKAQEQKQKKGLDNLEKRLLKAQKRKLQDQVNRLTELHNGLFPNGSLQERIQNFSEFYLEMGDQMVPTLVKNLDPFRKEFVVIEY